MKKFSTAIEWSESDWQTLRFAPAINCLDDFTKDFAVFGLGQTLADFGVGTFEGTKVAEWYWRASRLWPRKSSQEEFNRYARARISDYIGYARRRADAFYVVHRLFDRAKFAAVSLDEVIDAVAFLSKTEPLPSGSVIENGDAAFVDLTQRKDSPKVLKVDLEFLGTLKRLYPFERIDDVVVKHIPVGETSTREFSLVKLAWWSQNHATTLDEMNKAIGFRNGDKLDWTRANLFSKWRAAAVAYDSRVPPEFPERTDSNGNTRTVVDQYVGMSPAISAGLTLNREDLPSKSTKTARVLNWLREKTTAK